MDIVLSKETKEKLFLVVLAFGLLYVGYQQLYMPLGKKMNTARQTLYEKSTQFEQMKMKTDATKIVEKDLVLLQNTADKIDNILPKDSAVEKILHMVTKKMKTNSVSMSTFVPESITETPDYFELPFRISVSGSYHNIAKFFASLSRLTRLVTVKDIKLHYKEGSTSKDNVDASFLLVSYKYK